MVGDAAGYGGGGDAAAVGREACAAADCKGGWDCCNGEEVGKVKK